MIRKILLPTVVLITTSMLATAQTKFSSSMFGLIEARNIGPAVMGGRISAIDAVNSDPKTMYVGAAAGGVWKTITGGSVFKPIFDKYTQSIGAITIDQKSPKTVWVGTGESNMRNSVSIGTGIYKTTDGGDNWTLSGLDSTEHISKIIIDPKNSDIIYVAVPGALWSDSPHRGLYKSTDGGKSWNKIFYVDVKTGCADVAVDPGDPNIVYASMWQFRRQAWAFSSGGDGSGLFKSMDAGKTWKKIQNGFDGQQLGRICIAVSPNSPDNVYVIAESKNTSMYISHNKGESWAKTSNNENVSARPFYFSVIQVDPVDSSRIYRPAFVLSFSDDAGQSFSEASFQGGWVHSDMHALWINPKNPNQLYLGTDGGLYMSLDRGNNFFFVNNLPLSQFYHVAYDNQEPYNVYGGLQDNGSWTAPSQSPNGIENKDWDNVGGGDGFWVQPDLTDKNIVYSESQGGNISKVNRKTNEYKDIQPYPLAGEKKLRWNWNTPLCVSPTNPKTLYCGAQYVYRTLNQGDSWERISPDLTTNNADKQKQEESGGVTTDNSSAENHCTVFTISESPLNENLIWAGTDDGNLQVTTDGGKTWTNVVANIKGLPANTWCSSIEPGHYDKNTVYASFENHTRGDFTPYIFKSTDLGNTWTTISSADIKSFVHKIKEDIVNSKLLFAGTEMGLYVSFDGGINWTQFTNKVANTPIRDIQINPKTNDLIMASHGRGVLIIDDITPLRAINQQLMEQDFAFLPTRPNYLTMGQFGGGFPGAGGFVGPNSNEQAVILYYLKDRAMTGDMKVEIYDANNVLMQSIPGSKRKGINRVSWDMRMKPPKVPRGVRADYAGFFGPLVAEGSYKVKLIKAGKTVEGNIEMKPLPQSTHTKADRELQHNVAMETYNMEEKLAYMTEQVLAVRDTAKARQTATQDKKIVKALNDFIAKLEKQRGVYIAVKEGTAITGEEKIREKLSSIYATVNMYEGRPTDSQLERVKGLNFDIDAAQKDADVIWTVDLKKINDQLVKAGMQPLPFYTQELFDKTKDKL